MKTRFKITRALLASIRRDLDRPHPFAYERVGFISAGLATAGDNLLILARNYRPLMDHEYLPNISVGAMMGPDAIRSALQWALETGGAMFHVHTHGGFGVPSFSTIDICENAKFVLDFFKVASYAAHGAIVLSNDAVSGQVWCNRNEPYEFIQDFVEVGVPIRKWRGT
ncbi:MAG: hypothetical protein OXL95_10505 [Nitrospira sp.]|nr:hypothetical protein [Nitrospira sp.]